MKQCTKCGETKDFSEFNKNKNHKDGLQYKCKACQKQYARDNKEKRAEYMKQWRDNNKAKLAEYGKQYRDANKAKILKYRQDHKDYNAAYKKQRIANATPCVYRIKHKTSGLYYIGSTTRPLCDRVNHHFDKACCPTSPFTGKQKDNWDVTVLCYGTKSQVKELEKTLQKTRVNQDINCLNRRVG